jgi:hypothetical protein
MSFLPVSKIHNFAYNAPSRTLTISFGSPTSSIVRFWDVPEYEFLNLKYAEDQNEYYLENIRGQYEYTTVL